MSNLPFCQQDNGGNVHWGHRENFPCNTASGHVHAVAHVGKSKPLHVFDLARQQVGYLLHTSDEGPKDVIISIASPPPMRFIPARVVERRHVIISL